MVSTVAGPRRSDKKERQITIRFVEEDIQRVEQIAEEEGRTRSDVLRRLVHQALTEQAVREEMAFRDGVKAFMAAQEVEME